MSRLCGWLCRRREETQIRWCDSPVLKDHVHLLSPECHDLLDKIFVVDPKRRITIPQIMAHPFYTEFLTDGNKARRNSLRCYVEHTSIMSAC